MKSFFFCTLGLQAGGSVLHLCVIINLAMFVDEVTFLEIYPQFSAQINLIFLIIGNMVLILALTMTLITYAPAIQKNAMLDSERSAYNSAYSRACALSVLSGLAFGILLYLPKYVAKVFYQGLDMATEERAATISMLQILYLVVSIFYIIAFIVQAC